MTLRAAARLALAAAALPAGAQTAPEWSLAPTLEQVRLDEQAQGGGRLLREQGLLAGLRLQAAAPGWRAGVELAAGRVDYDGRTQGGAPIDSRTRQQRFAAEALLVRPLGCAWSGEGGIVVEHFRRRIEGTDGVGGLDERLWQPRLLAGVAGAFGGWSLAARLQLGPRAPLAVRFDGGAFDRTTLRSGRAKGLSVEIGRAIAPGWRVAAGFEHLEVGASLERTLTSDGAAVGVVRQPAWTRQRWMLSLAWAPGG